MEMQIKADFSQLTAEQREHLAGFILTFPPIPAELQASGTRKYRIDEEQPSPVPDDPAAAFGAQAPIDAAAPMVVIPPPPPPPPAIAQPATISASGVDKDGLPWDARIHAASKAKNADGSWRGKRGLDPTLLMQVKNELKALMAIPSAGPQLVPAPPVSVTGAPPPPPSVDNRQAFVSLVGRASAAMQANKITQEEIQSCCKSVDPMLISLPLLANRLDLVPQAAALIDAIIAGRSA